MRVDTDTQLINTGDKPSARRQKRRPRKGASSTNQAAISVEGIELESVMKAEMEQNGGKLDLEKASAMAVAGAGLTM